jgi:predicted negative regulator of RcsB-dependent stress response
MPEHDDALCDWWLRQILRLHADTRPPFDTILLLTSWCMWKETNNRTFQRTSAGLQAIYHAVLSETKDWISARIGTLNAVFTVWSQNLTIM